MGKLAHQFTAACENVLEAGAGLAVVVLEANLHRQGPEVQLLHVLRSSRAGLASAADIQLQQDFASILRLWRIADRRPEPD